MKASTAVFVVVALVLSAIAAATFLNPYASEQTPPPASQGQRGEASTVLPASGQITSASGENASSDNTNPASSPVPDVPPAGKETGEAVPPTPAGSQPSATSTAEEQEEEPSDSARNFLARLRSKPPLATWTRQVKEGIIKEISIYPAPEPDLPPLRVEFVYSAATGRPDDGSELFRISAADRLVIVTDLSAEDLKEPLRDAGASILHELGGGVFQIDVPAAREDWQALDRVEEAILASPELSVDKDYLLFPTAAPVVPNDPNVSLQWGLQDMNAGQAWATTTGLPGVVIAIADTGVDLAHPDLAPNIFQNPGEIGIDAQGRDKRTNGVDDDGNGFIDDYRGWDFGDSDNDATPRGSSSDHGTHVAGIAAARLNNGIGVAGVAGTSTILPLKLSKDASGSTFSSAMVAAQRYIVALKTRNTANIVAANFSYDSFQSGHSQPYLESFALSEAGVNSIWAAGNGGVDLSSTDPAMAYLLETTKKWSKIPGVIAVGSSRSNGTRRSTSSYGHDVVHLFAPGESIYATLPGARYGYKTGTSMAAPQVAGAVAILRSANPALGAEGAREALIRSANRTPAMADLSISNGRLELAAGTALARSLPVISLSHPHRILDEFAGTTTVTVTLDRTSPVPLSLPLRFAGTAHLGYDFEVSTTSVTIPANSRSATFTVRILNDSVREPTETIEIYTTAPGSHLLGASDQVWISIRDNDASSNIVQPRVSFSSGTLSVNEGETVAFDVLLDQPAPYALQIPIVPRMRQAGHGIEGVDYTFRPSDKLVRIPAGSQQGRVEIVALRDALVEGAEMFEIVWPDNIPGTSGYTGLYPLNVTINDGPVATPVAPSVRAISPQAGQIFPPATVSVRVEAEVTGTQTDPLSHVEIWNAGRLAATAIQVPGTTNRFAADLTGLATGNHTATIRAFSSLGASAEQSVSFQIAQAVPPSVSITSPANATIFRSSPSGVLLAAQVQPAAGRTIRNVTFFLDGRLMATATAPASPPSTFHAWFSAVGAGIHELRVEATDDLGTKASHSIQATWLDNRAPSVAIIQPSTALTILASQPIDILARATDPEGAIASLSFSANWRGIASAQITNPRPGEYRLTASGLPLGVHEIRCHATDSHGARTISAPLRVTVVEQLRDGITGTLNRDYWTGIDGPSLSALLNHPAYPGQPTGRDQIGGGFEALGWAGSSLEGSPTNFADRYGQRIYGFLVPEVSGNYTFWISGDDSCELLVSTSSDPALAGRIAWTDSSTPFRSWTTRPTQRSASIPLLADQPYYVEVRHKEATGGDHVSVGWAKPGQPTTGPSELIPAAVLTADLPVDNFVINGDFAAPMVVTPGYWISTATHADLGWVAMTGNSKFVITGDGTLTIANRGGFNAISQILRSDSLSGRLHISFRAKNTAIGGSLSFMVWGSRGPQRVLTVDQSGPHDSAWKQTSTLLYSQPTLSDSTYDWRTFTGILDLGETGYDFLTIKFFSTGGSGVTAFDDVTIK